MHDRLEQLLLALEIEEQRALGDTCVGGHFLETGGGVAFFDEERQGGVQQFAGPRLLAALAFDVDVVGLGLHGGRELMTDWLVM